MSLAKRLSNALRNPQSALDKIRDRRSRRNDSAQTRCVGKSKSNAERKACINALADTKIAIQAHIFYDDLAPEIASYLQNIPLAFDLYATTDAEEKVTRIRTDLENIPHLNTLEIQAFGNRGRDVLPFISQMANRIDDYDLICHIHTKRSLHFDKGDQWRLYLLDNLLGSEDIVLDIASDLVGPTPTGLAYPENFAPIAPFVEWAGNREVAKAALETIDKEIELPEDITFPAGDMFWARTDAVRDLFDARLLELWDQSTDNAENGTVMHAIERLWPYVARANGYSSAVHCCR